MVLQEPAELLREVRTLVRETRAAAALAPADLQPFPRPKSPQALRALAPGGGRGAPGGFGGAERGWPSGIRVPREILEGGVFRAPVAAPGRQQPPVAPSVGASPGRPTAHRGHTRAPLALPGVPVEGEEDYW